MEVKYDFLNITLKEIATIPKSLIILSNLLLPLWSRPPAPLHHIHPTLNHCREECDELRPILARKHQNEVFEERAKQIEISSIIKNREKEGEWGTY